jgi:hypothetical protein
MLDLAQRPDYGDGRWSRLTTLKWEGAMALTDQAPQSDKVKVTVYYDYI